MFSGGGYKLQLIVKLVILHKLIQNKKHYANKNLLFYVKSGIIINNTNKV